MFAGEVEAPVLPEVTVVVQGSDMRTAAAAGRPQRAPGDIEAVADQVTTGALDRAGGDGPGGREGDVTAELVEVIGEVADAERQAL
ncbi:hypothetical protein GCM10020295_57910 [Streptomyces cinereospinus]